MMTNILLLCFVLTAHTVADFCFQTDWMARNKSSSNRALLAHIGYYSFVLFSLLSLLMLTTVGQGHYITLIIYVLINALAHFITDYITSRLTTYYWKQEKRHEFFVVIGFDQLAHNVVLLVTFVWLFL